MASLGVRAYYGELPDSKLHDSEHRTRLENHIVALVRKENIKAIATLGLNGYCGHSDHVAAHHAALGAQQRLAAEAGIRVPILALNHDHQGELLVPVDAKTKLAALAIHQSQFGFLAESGELPAGYAMYNPLFSLETYDVIPA